jgi:DNA-binding Lrp family transcriptional regulator
MSVTEQSSQAEAMRLLKVLYDHNKTSSEPVLVERLATDVGLSEQEAQRAWRYLKDKGLIETFNIIYTARINASGIDAIEEVRRHPDRLAQSFPAVTYNIVNNNTTIGTAVNSPVQQTAGSGPPASSQDVAAKKTWIERLTSRTTALSALLIAIAGLLGTIPKIQEAATKAYCGVLPCAVTGPATPTYHVVRQVRCETRESIRNALIKWLEALSAKGDPIATRLVELYTSDPASIRGFQDSLFKGPESVASRAVMKSFYDAGIAYDFNRGFTQTDTFGGLLTTVPGEFCVGFISAAKNGGANGIDKFVIDFIQLSLLAAGKGPPSMVRDLIYNTGVGSTDKVTVALGMSEKLAGTALDQFKSRPAQ